MSENSNHSSLENVPLDIKKALIKKLRECINDKRHHSEGLIKCPKDPKHFATYRYTTFHRIEMYQCHQCGVRFVLMKQNGVLKLVSAPEKKQLVLRRKA